MSINSLRTHSTLLAEMQAAEAALLDISNNIGYHNPHTEDELTLLHEQLQSIIYAERHYDGDCDVSYDAERHGMSDVFTVPSYRSVL